MYGYRSLKEFLIKLNRGHREHGSESRLINADIWGDRGKIARSFIYKRLSSSTRTTVIKILNKQWDRAKHSKKQNKASRFSLRQNNNATLAQFNFRFD